MTPPQLFLTAARQGLDYLAVSDHNDPSGSALAIRERSAWPVGPTAIPAQEFSIEGHVHLVIYGVTETLTRCSLRRLPSLLCDLAAQDAAVWLAHPWTLWRGRKRDYALAMVTSLLDDGLINGVQMLTFAYQADRDQWRDSYRYFIKNWSGPPLAVAGYSDWHDHRHGYTPGICSTYLFSTSDEAGDLLKALRLGNTVARVDAATAKLFDLDCEDRRWWSGIHWSDEDLYLLGPDHLVQKLRDVKDLAWDLLQRKVQDQACHHAALSAFLQGNYRRVLELLKP
jgi:hypothetical protein